MREAVIVEAVRAPIGKRNGGLSGVHAASGAILMTRLVHHMRDNGIRFGLQTMCEGGGTANATIVELTD
jgi:acetyl-CoA acetyltransferase